MTHHLGRTPVIGSSFGFAVQEADERAVGSDFDLKDFERLPARSVPVDALSPRLRLRQGGTNAAHVRLLIDAASASELPPILVQEDGWRVIDGLHRLEAARLRGEHSIKARFLDCTDSEALVLAMKANSCHGLPLSKADRVAGAKRVLAAHPDWSDRAIAGITGLGAKTIASLRKETGAAAQADGKRLGRDGRRRPVNAGEGRRRVAEYITANPTASLRQVARETDVSLGTVHDVSTRLRRGVNPECSGRRTEAVRPAVRPAVGEPRAGSPAGAVAVVSAADGMPLRRRSHADAPFTWPEVAAKMAGDPTIRYTEGGKEFLRWMSLHAARPDGWRDHLDSVPAHWIGVIAPIADNVSREWGLFAERLKTRQETER